MNDMKAVIQPKSDQLNADDLLTGPKTIKITGVTIKAGQDQPISVNYEGDNGKPYKPCKSMCRVMVSAWGAESIKYTGRSMTLFADPKVKWAGLEIGGIRISHMSDIAETITMALTASKGNKKPYVIKPLVTVKTPEVKPPSANIDELADIFGGEQVITNTVQSMIEKVTRLILANEDKVPLTWQNAARDKMNDPQVTVADLEKVYNSIMEKVK